ncbi:MAG: helix-turn-helix domain-containing protein [Thermoleophilia bacterium]|nr:helix-turn-helix domain-containing protein [Thermoleophilia bacterium]
MTATRGSRRAQRLALASLVERIDERAARDGSSIRSVCARLGISPGTISRLRDGRAPDAFAIVSILDWLDMAPGELLVQRSPSAGRAKPLPPEIERARRAAIDVPASR